MQSTINALAPIFHGYPAAPPVAIIFRHHAVGNSSTRHINSAAMTILIFPHAIAPVMVNPETMALEWVIYSGEQVSSV